MYIALTSHSSDSNITRPLLDRLARAIEDQVYNDYATLWQAAGMPVRAFDSPGDIPDDGRAAPLIIFDEPDQADALGYHAMTPKGLAYGKAFWGLIRNNGGSLHDSDNSLSVTLSHETLEMVGSPYANSWYDMPDGVTEDAGELCDRVQGDSYIRSGIAVSNFLGPRAFRDGPGPYDYMGLLLTPWEVRSDPLHPGYAIRRTGGPAGDTFTVGLEKLPMWLQGIKGNRFGRFQIRMW